MAEKKVTGFKDLVNFIKIMPVRERHIKDADAVLPPADYGVNRLAKLLHPEKQNLKIAKVVDHGDAKSFVLVPDTEKGTDHCAYFRAGQYLSVMLDIDGVPVSKPYSICSGPQEALDGSYTLTIKRTADGFASDYILDNWKEGDRVTTAAPEGQFYWTSLRDAKTIVGLAGGSGITPFHSMASAIVTGQMDADLILLYGSRKEDNILLKAEFDELEKMSDRIKVIHVLSDDPDAEGYEHGFLSADLIRKYAPDGDYSIFLCGPKAMYDFVDKEIETLNLRSNRVRHELFGEAYHPEKSGDYPKECVGRKYNVEVIVRGESRKIQCPADMTLLRAMEFAGIAAPSRCRAGECGFCHSRLVSGTVYIPKEGDGRRIADKEYGWIHPCSTFPTSDVVIDVPTRDHKD